MNLWRSMLLVSGSMAVLTVSSCSHAPAKPAAPTAVAVQFTRAARQTISDIVTGGGVIYPLHQASLTPKVSSPVKRFYVNRGDPVRRGELLAVLENNDLAGATVTAEGGYDQATATYRKAISVGLPEQLQAASLAVQNARAARETQQKLYDSYLWLYQQHAGARAQVDQAAVALITAKSQELTARKQLADLQAVGRTEDAHAAKGQLEAARGQFLSAKAQLRYTELRSPIAGVLADRSIYVGDIAQAGTPLLIVMDVSRVIVRLHLPHSQTSGLKLGDDALLHVPGLKQSVHGKVSVISPALDPNSTTVEVWVQAPNPRNDLKPGTSVQVDLIARVIPNATVVPSSSLLTGNNGARSVMLVGSDSRARRQNVTTGVEQNNAVQILAGLQPGDLIVATGAYGLPDNTKVTAAPASAAVPTPTGAQP